LTTKFRLDIFCRAQNPVLRNVQSSSGQQTPAAFCFLGPKLFEEVNMKLRNLIIVLAAAVAVYCVPALAETAANPSPSDTAALDGSSGSSGGSMGTTDSSDGSFGNTGTNTGGRDTGATPGSHGYGNATGMEKGRKFHNVTGMGGGGSMGGSSGGGWGGSSGGSSSGGSSSGGMGGGSSPGGY
jgi:hypothetical protein